MDATALLTHLNLKHDPGAVAEALDGENPAACATRIRSVSGRGGVMSHESKLSRVISNSTQIGLHSRWLMARVRVGVLRDCWDSAGIVLG